MKTQKVLLITLLALMLVMPMVAADMAETFISSIGGTTGWLYSHLAPSMTSVETFFGGDLSPVSLLIVGILVTIMLFAVMLDIITLVTPFNKITNWIIAIGIALIGVISSLTVKVAAGVILIGARLFAWAGAAGIILTIVLAIIVIYFIFFGGEWVKRWINNIKDRGEQAQQLRKGKRLGSNISALGEAAETALSRQKA